MNRAPLFVSLALCAIVAILLLVDIYQVHRDIRRNRAAIERLSSECTAAEQRRKDLEERIQRLKSDRRVMERLLFEKYRLLRPDQYIVHDPHH